MVEELEPGVAKLTFLDVEDVTAAWSNAESMAHDVGGSIHHCEIHNSILKDGR